MTNEEAKEIIKQFRDRQGNSKDDIEALDVAIKALEQTELNPSYNSVKSELESREDCFRELIREFDNKHPSIFAFYMEKFNSHPLAEIIDYMWDMHDLIEDIRYRLPMEVEE